VGSSKSTTPNTSERRLALAELEKKRADKSFRQQADQTQLGICAEVKPKFFRPEPGTLTKATQSCERFSIDFKGPLVPSEERKNRYILTVVDEYS